MCLVQREFGGALLNIMNYIFTNILFKDNPVDPVVVPYVPNDVSWVDT